MSSASTTFTATGCDSCCGIPVTCTGMECRVRGGTATLCGFEEYVSPSTPPNKYRRQTISGTNSSQTYSDSGCTVPTGASVTCTIDFVCQYNSSTCVPTASGAGQICNGSFIQPANCNPLVYNPTPACDTNESATPTQITFSSSGACCLSSPGIWEKSTADSRTATLTDQDTDSDALSRLLAGAGGTWGSWIASGGVGCTGTPPSCCIAGWEIRSSGFSFGYQESQFRVPFTGLTPSTRYSISIQIYRRVYGAGSYTLFATLYLSDVSDVSGNLTFTGDVPNAAGFQTYASCT